MPTTRRSASLAASASDSVASEDPRWLAVLARDRAADGSFVYAVHSTGIYCRPSCASRRPRPDGVSFFLTPAAARAASFRACHRCQPDAPLSLTDTWLNAARTYLVQHRDRIVPLAELARHTGISVTHLQRAFRQAFGLSPREFQSGLRSHALAKSLTSAPHQGAATLTDTVYAAGFSSTSRAHSATRSTLAMSPKAARRGAAGEFIVFAVVSSALGKLLVAATARGLCRVAFADTSGSLSSELRSFRADFHAADLLAADLLAADFLAADSGAIPSTHAPAAQILNSALPQLLHLASGEHAAAIPVDMRGTVFQQRVWRTLQKIPTGQTRTYAQIAESIGSPTAARAVARACATNDIALAIPCHRVNASNGSLAGYRWGIPRKRKLQQSEAQSAASAD
jgi:AraC family transcriptional regulator, regulatory protein of adaptative response / methylated-DNA-[protein]-cysteine methyltransferase